MRSARESNKAMKDDQYKIEKGIPLPGLRSWRRSELRRLLSSLEIGDSVLFPLAKRTQVSNAAKAVGIRVITRTVDATNIRIWRVEAS